MPDILGQSQWITAAGLLVGCGLSLLVFSAIFGDHVVARLGQYILVGSVLGYAAFVTVAALRQLALFQALAADPVQNGVHWIGVALAVILAAAVLERIFAQGEAGPPRRGWRRWLRMVGTLPIALLLGVGVSVALLGSLQGTLAPQLTTAARTGIEWGAAWERFLTGLLVLLVTASALLYFTVDPVRHLAAQPAAVRRFMRSWIWIGQRAVWLAAGVIFARLAASRISLLVALFDYWRTAVVDTSLWQSVVLWWRHLAGM